MKNVRVGLLGFSQGYYATTYLRYLAKLKNVEVIGCCDFGESNSYVMECAGTTAEEFCERLEVERYHDIDQLLGRAPDSVLVCSETRDHAKHSKLAMEAGADVFIAKPAAFSSLDVNILMRTSASTGRKVICGQPLRYEKGLQEMRQSIAAGAIGRVTNIRLLINHEAMIHQEWERDSLRSGGPLGTYGIYLFDVVYMLCGLRAKELFAYGANLVYKQINNSDTIQIIAKMENEALANLNLVATMSWETPFVQVEIVGEKGIISGEYDNNMFKLVRDSEVLIGSLRTSDMGVGEMENFLTALCDGEDLGPSLEEMLYVTSCLEAVERSIKTGQRQSIVMDRAL